MTVPTFCFALMTMASLGACPGKDLSSPADVLPPGPVSNVAEEPGVVPAGSSLVVQTEDAITAVRAMRATIYTANVAEDVVDQDGTVLIPKDSPVELGVRSLPYLGPGGVGMTELILEVRAVTVKGIRYPVATASANPGAGGLGLERASARCELIELGLALGRNARAIWQDLVDAHGFTAGYSSMNATLLKALVTLVPVGMLFLGSAILFSRGRKLGSLLQLVGAGALVLVVLTHIFEALHFLPWMQWGAEHKRWTLR